jgi:hypothetical protein
VVQNIWDFEVNRIDGVIVKSEAEVTLGEVKEWLETVHKEFHFDISSFAAHFDTWSATRQDIVIKLTRAWLIDKAIKAEQEKL